MRNTLRGFAMAAIVAVSVVFASAALAAEVIDLSQIKRESDLINALGYPSEKILGGLVYPRGVNVDVRVGGNWSVNTPDYPEQKSAPARTIIPAGTPMTLYLHRENIRSLWELNDFIRENGGKLSRIKGLPGFAFSYSVESDIRHWVGKTLLPFSEAGLRLDVNGRGESGHEPRKGETFVIVDEEAYLNFVPQNVDEIKALSLHPLCNGAEIVDAGRGVKIRGFVSDWKVAKGFTVHTKRGVIKEGDIVNESEWGTVYGTVLEKPDPTPTPTPTPAPAPAPNPAPQPLPDSNGNGGEGGGGGCNGGMGCAALLLVPFLKKGRRS